MIYNNHAYIKNQQNKNLKIQMQKELDNLSPREYILNRLSMNSLEWDYEKQNFKKK